MNRSKHNLIHSLTSRNWHMRTPAAIGYLPLVVSVLSGETTSFFDDEEVNEEKKKARVESFIKANAISAVPYEVPDMYYYDFPPFRIGNIGVIPVMDAIMQYDYCGGAGTKTITSWYAAMLEDPNIIGIMELANSGGGDVLGTAELANYKLFVKQFKPIGTLTEGYCCSAMEYIASSSNFIMATSKSVIGGSIGVMTTYVNFKKYYEEKGITVEEIYSKDSPKKNHAHRLAAEGDYSAYADGLLFKLDESFMAFVKENRPKISDDALKGTEYAAEDAIAEGVFDYIGTIDDAIAKITELANTQSNKNTQKMKQLWQSFAQKLGLTVAEKADKSELTEEDYAAAVAENILGLKSKLAEEKPQGISEEALTEKLKNFVSVETFNALKSEHDKEVAAQKATSEALTALQSKVPGASATVPVAEEDKEPIESAWVGTPIQ